MSVRTSVLKDWAIYTGASFLLVLPFLMWLMVRFTHQPWARAGLLASLLLGLPVLAWGMGRALHRAQVQQIRDTEQLAAEEKVRAITGHAPLPLAFVDESFRFVFANERYQNWIGLKLGQLIGKTPLELFGQDVGTSMIARLKRCVEGEGLSYEARAENGRLYSVSYTRSQPGPGPLGVYIAATDITDYRAIEGSLAEERHRAQVTLQSIAEGVISCDRQGRIEYFNTAAARMLGLDVHQVQGKLVEEVLICADLETTRPAATSLTLALRHRQLITARASCALYDYGNQRSFPIEETASPILTPGGELQGAVMIFHDISEKHRATEQMRHLAYHDGLTGLPNRVALRGAIDDTIELRARRSAPASAAIMFIDADQFKHFNDSLGHAAGDRIIQSIGERLTRVVGSRGMVSRQGGDEFVVWMSHVEGDASLAEMAEAIREEVREHIEVDAPSTVQLSASIGIAVFPRDGVNADTLLKHADLALYEAKRLGRDQYQFFHPALAEAAVMRMKIDQDLRRAIRDNELVLHYQPIVDTRSGKILCAEALVRWPRADGMWMPGQFVPIAEESSLIAELDAWVVREACRQQQEWTKMGLGVVPVSVNLSMMRLNPEAFLSIMQSALSAGCGECKLQVEVTESQMIHDPKQLEFLIAELREMGISVALDDFGTGYSNLSYLGAYRFDVLKIDKSFVARLDEEQCRQIVRAILAVGRSLGCKVVAEGVEDQRQLVALAQEGCDAVQGFLYAKPMSAAHLMHWCVNNAISPIHALPPLPAFPALERPQVSAA